MEDQRVETLKHIEEVKKQIDIVVVALQDRAAKHDASKLESPEREIFDKYTPKLKGTTYGSEEYKQCLAGMKTALDHHYASNRHHPEHFVYHECNGCFERYYQEVNICNICGYSQFTDRPDIAQMNLIDLVEMFCDWKAATLRHTDGDIKKSIAINKKRFEISDELTAILLNTVEILND
ncbi:hypothetical protein LCGC14_1273470 [marine sediment metagenome]|uniref:Uncharacterized protein n=1 Tax=marine sediment metagenome TaxID=412755 RepID=A0A0F9NE36_9ZZZZ|nr:hypothetical protein [Pricia sp.]